MSSHHIVREDQEPALVIANAEGATRVIQEFLEWSPLVLVLEQALEKTLLMGIKVDVVVGKYGNRERLCALVRDQAPVKVLTVQEGDGNLDTAIMFLKAGKYKGATFIGVDPHSFSVSSVSFGITCVNGAIHWSLIQNGKFEKWLPAHSVVYVLPADRNYSLSQASKRVSETDGWLRVEEKFPFWIGEPMVSEE